MSSHDIPESVREVLVEEEIENVRQRNGWAVGTVKLYDHGGVTKEIEDAIIELFNGEGSAGEFGGVRFMAEHDGEYEEAYAYATREALIELGREGWFVDEFTDPENPDYGDPSP